MLLASACVILLSSASAEGERMRPCVPTPWPACLQAGTNEQFELNVRPALDSPGAALDRVKMFIYTNFAKWGLPCPITGHPSTMSSGE